MIESIVLGILATAIILVIIFLVARLKADKEVEEIVLRLEEKTQKLLSILPISSPAPQVNVNLKPVEDAVKALPNKVLQSIQSSVNARKGVLGELIGYIELQAMYDRIIPLNSITDFVCIKLPSSDNEGHIDFVDIKTGKTARLSKEQKQLQQLIIDKKINFVKLNVSAQSSETIFKTD